MYEEQQADVLAELRQEEADRKAGIVKRVPKPKAPKPSKWVKFFRNLLKVIRFTWKIVRSRGFMYFTLLTALVSGAFYLFVLVSTFYKANDVNFRPVVLWSFKPQIPWTVTPKQIQKVYVPVTTGDIKGTGTKASNLTEEQKVAMIMKLSEFPKQLLKIRMLESTNGSKDVQGLHTFCESVGMTNEFGFDPFAVTGNRCFATYEDSIKAVDELLGDLLTKYSLNESICIYNTGNGAECTYLAHYKAL